MEKGKKKRGKEKVESGKGIRDIKASNGNRNGNREKRSYKCSYFYSYYYSYYYSILLLLVFFQNFSQLCQVLDDGTPFTAQALPEFRVSQKQEKGAGTVVDVAHAIPVKDGEKAA